MHRRSEAELLPLDTELERTLRNLKKVRAGEEEVMVEHKEGDLNITVVATDKRQQR